MQAIRIESIIETRRTLVSAFGTASEQEPMRIWPNVKHIVVEKKNQSQHMTAPSVFGGQRTPHNEAAHGLVESDCKDMSRDGMDCAARYK